MSLPAICMQCNQKIINYPNQLCRKQFLPAFQRTRGIQENRVNNLKSIINKLRNKKENEFKNELIDSRTSGNSKLDEFINDTQLTSKYCDDFIEWIPISNLENMEFLTNGGNSKVYCGTWNLLKMPLNSKQLSTKIALKVIRDSDDFNDYTLNEVKNAI
jgi:hypothetical protein